jgi:hypothetical protein
MARIFSYPLNVMLRFLKCVGVNAGGVGVGGYFIICMAHNHSLTQTHLPIHPHPHPSR